jgi:RNA polymerase sigma-70 factor (ECF subfamily)
LDNFNNIYKDNYKSTLRVAIKIIGDNHIAADIVQEVFIDLYKKLQNKEIIKNYKAWLYRLTYNKSIDYFRSVKKNTTTEFNDNNHTNEISNCYDTTTIDELQKALARMKPKDKLLMVLYSEGLSYREISEVANIKYSSVGKTISRTIEKLEQELKLQYHDLY